MLSRAEFLVNTGVGIQKGVSKEGLNGLLVSGGVK